MEVWKQIDGYPDYEVSNLGRVRSWRNKKESEPRVLKPFPCGRLRQYLAVGLSDTNNKQHSKSVHTLVLTAFVGSRPQDKECRHLNGVPSDNRLDNLQWGTKVENAADRARHGTERFGQHHPNSKLTDAQIEEMKNLYAAGGWSQRTLAGRFGVTKSTVGRILIGKRNQ